VPAAASFTDISTSPYQSAIEALAQTNTIGGYDDGTFRPLNPLLRAQFAKIVDGALGFAVTEDLTQGKTSTTFEPFLPVIRAPASSMAVRSAAL